MRICSFLPSVTEMLYALGAGDSVAGVTFECDFPAEARKKRVVVRTRLKTERSAAEIDRQVNEFLARGESLYEVDLEALREIKPDLIITQDLCHVCAATPGDLAYALQVLPRSPKVLSLSPKTLEDVWNDLWSVGKAIGRSHRAEELVRKLKQRLMAVEQAVVHAQDKPRVACLEWLDPPFAAGHWVPEMVARAGGADALAESAKPGFRTTWESVLKSKPEIIGIMPCGYGLKEAVEEFNHMSLPEGWQRLPAVRAGRVFAVDASGYFSRPGPRLAAGVEILAHVLHPSCATVKPPEGSMEWLPGKAQQTATT